MRSFLPNYAPINTLTCCANCQKEAEPFTLKMCTACRSACYCDIDCQKAHRKNHKYQCNQDMKFLKAKTVSYHDITDQGDTIDDDDDDDDALFEPIPPKDDCPICTLPLPLANWGSTYNPCCGNLICKGCCEEDNRVTLDRGLDPCCPFCRELHPSSENEMIIRVKKRMKMNDSVAIYNASQWYRFGLYNTPKDSQKAFKLSLRAAKLGNLDACTDTAVCYNNGTGVQQDKAKSAEYTKKAVKGGNIEARRNLGNDEQNKRNFRLANTHWLISAAAGHTPS